MRRAYLLLFGCILCRAVFVEAHAARNIAYTKRWLQDVPVHVVTANLNSTQLTVSAAIARNGIGTTEGFGSMLSRLKPSAAVTGTYFCVRSHIPVGDIVVDGTPVNLGVVGTGVCFTADNRVEFKPTISARTMDWTGYPFVICAGPRLVKNGTASVAPWAEGFRDGGLYKKARRAGLGVTKHNKLLLVTVNRPIYLSRLARIMRDLGAVEAVNLDGGTSTALYFDGRVFSHPGRRLTNLIVVYESPIQFARIKSQLAPSPAAADPPSKS